MVIHSVIVAVSNRSVLGGNTFLLRLCCVQGAKGLSVHTSTQTCYSCSFTKVRLLSHCGAKCEQTVVRNSRLHGARRTVKFTVFLNQSIAAIFFCATVIFDCGGDLKMVSCHFHTVHCTNARFGFLKCSCSYAHT